jgi:hypothetical protein
MAQISAMLVQTYVRSIVAVGGVFPADPDWMNNAVPVPTDDANEPYPLWLTTSSGQMPRGVSLNIGVYFKYFNGNDQIYGGTADIQSFFFADPMTSSLPNTARAVWSGGETFVAASSDVMQTFRTPPDVRMGVRLSNFAGYGAATRLAISMTRLCPQ